MKLVWVAQAGVFFRFFLIGCLVLISATNALAQCSFSPELGFDPLTFPQYPTGFDGNNYPDENAALSAAKLSFFGPTGSFGNRSTSEVCRGQYISMELSLIQGGGAGEIVFWESGSYPLSQFAGSSVLQVAYSQGFCTGGVITRTRQGVYAPGPVLTCKQMVVPTLSLSGLSETRPTGTGGASTITFTAKITAPNGQPKAGVALSFSADVKPNSGGHDHHFTTRPKGSLSPTQGVTNANGELAITFTAPEFAGIHTIKATCPSCSNKEVSKEIQVKVPGLIELGADTGKPPEYALVGAISGKHTSNHWFTPTATRQLDKVVGLMYETGWGQVGVNDGSLIWGGLFDVKTAWTTPHTGHRLGTEVDISFNNPKAITEFQKKKAYSELCKKDNAALGVQTLWHEDDAYPDHFHIYLTGQGLTSKAGGGPCCMSYVKWEPVLNKDKTPVIGKDGKPVLKAVSYCEETTPR